MRIGRGSGNLPGYEGSAVAARTGVVIDTAGLAAGARYEGEMALEYNDGEMRTMTREAILDAAGVPVFTGRYILEGRRGMVIRSITVKNTGGVDIVHHIGRTDVSGAVYLNIDAGGAVLLRAPAGGGVIPVWTGAEMQAMAPDSQTANRKYLLEGDLDLSGKAVHPYLWEPVGKFSAGLRFQGEFDGGNHTLRSLYINKSSGSSYVGLFGYTDYATLKNIRVEDGSVTGGFYVGGVAGLVGHGSATGCSYTGSVTGGSNVGGVAGVVSHTNVTGCYNTGGVAGTDKTGGVAGLASNGAIVLCYNTGDVSGASYTGGVVGWTEGSPVTGCYNTGNVSGGSSTGGVAGYVVRLGAPREITACYNTGSVSGTSNTGGVAGYVVSDSITACYNTGYVSGDPSTGGVAGRIDSAGAITACYSIGYVSGTSDAGGVAGTVSGAATACYWDRRAAPGLPGVGSGVDTTLSFYGSWDFPNLAALPLPDPAWGTSSYWSGPIGTEPSVWWLAGTTGGGRLPKLCFQSR